MDEHQKGIQIGLRAAATFLESEADEADEVARQHPDQPPVMTPTQLAQLLRGLATQIRELKVTRGR